MIHLRKKRCATGDVAATRCDFVWIVSQVNRIQLDLGEARRSHKLLTAHQILSGPSVPESNLLSLALVLTCSDAADPLRAQLLLSIVVRGANNVDYFEYALRASQPGIVQLAPKLTLHEELASVEILL